MDNTQIALAQLAGDVAHTAALRDGESAETASDAYHVTFLIVMLCSDQVTDDCACVLPDQSCSACRSSARVAYPLHEVGV